MTGVQTCALPISFTHEEENPWARTETGPLVLTLQLGKKMVGRVLVDSGSTTDILYWDTFLNLGLQDGHLRPTKCILHGFSGERIRALGAATVEMTLGNRDGPRRKELVDFVVQFSLSKNLAMPTVHST